MLTVTVARAKHLIISEIKLGEGLGWIQLGVSRSGAPVIAPFGRYSCSPERGRVHRRRGLPTENR
jgi:hypothetical protein